MNSRLILRTLKAALKKRNLTYRELGAKLGLTEAAIKKQFQASDVSFNRVIEICQLLDISVNVLIEAAKSNPIQELELSIHQQRFFLKNPECFIFFLKLSHAKGDVSKANEDIRWSEDRLWRNLKSLDDLSLIRLHQGSRVELIYGSLLTISTQNTPLSQITQHLGIKFLERFQDALGRDMGGIKISLLKLSEDNIEILRRDLDRIHKTQLRQSEIDSAILPEKDLRTCSLMVAAGEFSFL